MAVCPPEESPARMTRAGSTPYFAALARRKRTALRASRAWAGKEAMPLWRYSTMAHT